MENKTGRITKESDGYKVSFSRILNYNINTVWEVITNPEKLKLWFTDFEMEFKTGGKIIIRFKDESRTETYGKIVEIKPPHRFVYTWEGELAEWELFEEDETRCLLTLKYSKLNNEYAVSVPAGFHVLLDQLEDVLGGSPGDYPFGAGEPSKEEIKIREHYKEQILSEYPELMAYQPVVVERIYNAPVEKVWKAITEKDQMKQWYFDLEDFKPEVGFEFRFKGQGHKGENYVHICRITEVIPNHKLVHTWTYEGYSGTSTVTFELFDRGANTKLRLTHQGLHTFPMENPDFARDSFNGGWNELIGVLLKNYVES